MVDWALKNAKNLFAAENYGSVSLTTEQIQYILSDKDFSGVFDIDKLVLDENTINYIIKNNPGLFKVSKKAIYQLNEEQLNYLVKNFSYVFEGLMYSASNSRENTKIISNFLGRERLTILFNSQPKFFALDDLACFTNIFPTFLTGELLHSYVIKHTPESDPLKFYSLRRLTEFIRYMDSNTQFYILKYYPKLFLSSNMIFQQLSEVAGKYIFDNFFEWLNSYQGGGTSYNYRGFKFNIYDWNLSESQKEKLIKSEVEGETSLLEYYDAEELEKFNFNEKQINELLDEDSYVRSNLSIDMIKGFKLTPESSEPLIAQILKDSDEQKTTYEEVINLFGEDFMAKIYRDNSDDFDSLQLAIKYKDIESLKKHNNAYYTYTENVIQFRFDDWSDEDLIELYEEPDKAKTVLNNDLDFYGFDYNFSDTDIDDLTPLNIARIKFLLKKAYPKKFSKLFSTMSNGDLNTLLHDPEEIKGYDSEKDEYNEDIIEHIKDSLIRATEDAQRNADEDEYWNKTTEPMTSRFGKPIWSKQKVSKFDKETGKNKEEQKELLQFEISYSAFYDYIVAAQDSMSDTDWEYSLNSNPISVIQTGMKESDELLEININENYGVYGDRESSVVDEYFAERLYDNKEISNMLDKARVVVKRKPK
jgi:hypothetical protein